jgi:hypothetical protein
VPGERVSAAAPAHTVLPTADPVGTVHRRFPDKQLLIEALLEYGLAELRERLLERSFNAALEL